MLDNCPDLHICENRLSEAVKHVRLLGEIPLSDQDIEILTGLVRGAITPNISKGTRYLKTEAPACMACFLVGMGRFYDKETGFWSILKEKVGSIDLNWQVKWGKIFLQYLEQNDLPKFDEEKGEAYVTPILCHTCIPDCCLDEYFDQVLVPLVNRDLLNPLDQEEIIHDLRVKRKINSNRLELEQTRRIQEDRLKVLQKESEDPTIRLEIFKQVASLLAEEDECERRKIALHGLEEVELIRTNLLDRIRDGTVRIQKLESDGKRLWEEITLFKKRYQPILEHESQIDDVIRNYQRLKDGLPKARDNEKSLIDVVTTQWARLSTEPWNDNFGVEISGFPLEQLSSQIDQHQNLREQLKTVQVKIDDLLASQKEQKKSSTFISALHNFINNTLIWFGRKRPVQRPNELQQLQVTYGETAVEIQLQQERIIELFARLPIRDELLEDPFIDLCEEFRSFKIVYSGFVDAREKLGKFEEEQDQLKGQVQELVIRLGLTADGHINARVKRLSVTLKEAHQSKANALEAKRILEKDIRPVFESARLEYHSLLADLEKLDQQLAELGGGSTQQGLNLVQEFHRYHAAVVQTRQNLSSLYSDFASLESELRSQGFEVISMSLEKTAAEIDKRIQAAKSELERSKKGLDNYPFQYFGIDEPIRRLLLYGGVTAEKYLINSVMLFARAKSGEKVEDISDVILPNRITQHFQQWWETYRTKAELKPTGEEEVNPATGERYRAPQIFFDVATGEVIAKLPSQRFLRPEHGTTVQLDVLGDELKNPIYTVQLKLYNRPRGLVETHSRDDIVLTIPTEKYIFRLKSKDNPIHEWEIQGPSDRAPFLAFSPSSYKLIKGENLPRSPLIVVILERLRIHPQECILTEGSFLFGGWKEYAWYEVDLSTVEEFNLLGDSGQSLSIPLTSDLGSGIVLLGGNQLAGVLSDGRPVFNLPPISIQVPLNDQGDLHLLRLSILSEDENRTIKSKHYQVDELIDFIGIHDEGSLEIPLSIEQLLGTDPIGCFTLRVYKPPYLDWQRLFCIIPRLKVSFDQEMYLPYRGVIPDITTTLTLPERDTFKPDSPAKLVSSDRTPWMVQTPASENEITGMLLCSTVDGKRINIPITIFVPKLRWRLQGRDDPEYDQWFDEVKEELWIGDWIEAQELFLIVETPWFYKGEVSLVLPGNLISIEIGKVDDQKTRVDMKALEDTLRAGPSLETVAISLKEIQTKIPDIPLFTVRTRWQAENIKCLPYPEDDTKRLSVSWNEKGRAEQVIVRLWRLSGKQYILVKDQVVRQDKHDVVFGLKNVEFPSGTYLIHLEPYDPWSPRPVFPQINAPNTQLIEIKWEIPKDIVTLQSVCVEVYVNDQRIKPLPPNAYNIQIIGKVKNWKLPEDLTIENIDHILVTSYNEDWFVGNIEVNGVPEVIAHLIDTNPVKFEYDTQKRIVTSIEDRHGDGAVYCWDCNMLFWHQETVLKEKKEHGKHNYLPIEFRIIWKSEE